MALVQRFDVGRLDRTKRTGAGGARMPASIARTGVQTYRRADGREVREYRPPSVVFDAAALDTLAGVPVTIGHHGLVDAKSWRRLAVGHVTETPPSRREDGPHAWIDASVIVQDADALARVESGELVEVSAGYLAEVDEAPGVTPEGERYDTKQTRIVFNHLALLPVGHARAGSGARLRLDGNQEMLVRQDDAATPAQQAPARPRVKVDGIDCDYGSDVHVQMLERQIASAVQRADAADGKVKAAETATGEAKAALATAQAELTTLKARDVGALVQDELDFRSRLLPILPKADGKAYDFTGKSRDQVRADALGAAVMADVAKLPDGERAGYVTAMIKQRLDAASGTNGDRLYTPPAKSPEATREDGPVKPKSAIARHQDAFNASFGGTK